MSDQPNVFILGSGGAVIEMALPLHETIVDQLARGYARRVQADGSPYTGDAPDVPSLPTTRPALNAQKVEWIGWAVTNGMQPDDAEALTKADLVERFGQIEPGNGRHVDPDGTGPDDQAVDGDVPDVAANTDRTISA